MKKYPKHIKKLGIELQMESASIFGSQEEVKTLTFDPKDQRHEALVELLMKYFTYKHRLEEIVYRAEDHFGIDDLRDVYEASFYAILENEDWVQMTYDVNGIEYPSMDDQVDWLSEQAKEDE